MDILNISLVIYLFFNEFRFYIWVLLFWDFGLIFYYYWKALGPCYPSNGLSIFVSLALYLLYLSWPKYFFLILYYSGDIIMLLFFLILKSSQIRCIIKTGYILTCHINLKTLQHYPCRPCWCLQCWVGLSCAKAPMSSMWRQVNQLIYCSLE